MTSRRRESLDENEHGSLYAEYLVVLGVIGAVVALAVSALAEPLIQFFQQAQAVTLLPL